MAHYVIGDVHGCYRTLLALLQKIQYKPAQDNLYFVGDLVGRGPQPKEVVRFVVETPNVVTVLGNHDLWCMAVAYGCHQDDSSEFSALFQNDLDLLNSWRQQAQFCLYAPMHHFAVVHAGILPQWSITKAMQLAAEVESQLKDTNFKALLSELEGDQPYCWHEDLQGIDRFRCIVNVMTRMRFCDAQGCLDFREKSVTQSQFAHLRPWFEWPNQLQDCRLFYGHWAALGGLSTVENIVATDTGCVYGGKLSAFKIGSAEEDILCYRVDNCEYI